MVGLLLLHRGLQALGPTASIPTILILIMFGMGLVASAGRWGDWLYLGLAVVLFLGSVSAIYAGFTKPISLWPNEFWRYAGIGINSVGVLGFILAVKTAINERFT